MKKIVFNLPDSLDMDEKEVAAMLAAELYDKGKLSLGQAADLIGFTKEQFMSVLGKYGVSIFGETMEDIEKDIKNA